MKMTNLDNLIDQLTESGAHPVSVDLIHTAFRAYSDWMAKCQVNKVNPELAENSVLALIAMIIVDMVTKVRVADEKGESLKYMVHAKEFITELMIQTYQNLHNIDEIKPGGHLQ